VTPANLHDVSITPEEIRYEPLGPADAWNIHIDRGNPTQAGWVPTDHDNEAPDEGPEPVRATVRNQLIRAAAFETGALENLYQAAPGATVSIAREDEGWEEQLADAGRNAETAFTDQLAGYNLAYEFAKDGRGYQMNEGFIREIHEVATASQATYPVTVNGHEETRPLHHGQYKTDENKVINRFGRIKNYAPPVDVAIEMHTLISGYNQLQEAGAEPYALAAYLHWGITRIHPFDDGNGRVARIAASVIFFQAYGFPLTIFSDRKRTYLQALEAADAGKPRDFVDYVWWRAADIHHWRNELMEIHTATRTATSISDIQQIIAAQQNAAEPPKELAQRVGDYLLAELETRLRAALSGVASLEIRHEDFYHYVTGDFTVLQTQSRRLEIRVDEPLHALVTRQIAFTYANQAADHAVIVLTVSPGLSGDSLELKLRHNDCSPQLSTEAQARIDSYLTVLTTRLTAQLRDELEAAARANGTLPNLEPNTATDTQNE